MSLREELDKLEQWDDRHERGKLFETFLGRLLKEEGFEVTSDPEAATPLQTDLSARRGQMCFLVEAKWLGRPIHLGQVSAVRERLRNTPRDVFACLFSMSEFGRGAVAEACRERTHEIILFNSREVRAIAIGESSFDELLDRKRDALRTHADVWFWERNQKAHRSSLLRSGPDVFQFGSETRDYLLCKTGLNDGLFCNESLDFTGRNSGAAISLYLRLDLKSIADLERILRKAGNLFGMANEGAFSIHQGDVGWFGFGFDHFLGAVKEQQSRYAQLNWNSYHHSEELAYLDRIQSGGLFCLSSRQSTGRGNQLHSALIEIFMPGIPVEMAAIRKFCSSTGNGDAILESLGENPIKKLAFRRKVEVEPVATIVSDSDGSKYVSGLVVKNPFLHGRSPIPKGVSIEEPFGLLPKHEFLFCALRSWHNTNVRAGRYELLFAEACWIGHYAAFWILCDWI